MGRERAGNTKNNLVIALWLVSILALTLVTILVWGIHTVNSASQAYLSLQAQKKLTVQIDPTPVVETPQATATLPSQPVALAAANTPSPLSTIQAIYQKGQALGNDPHAFSKVGDCNSLEPYFLVNFDLDPSTYNLGTYTLLQPAIQQFNGSFKRKSLAVADGFNTSAVLSPSRADPNQCGNNETPLACEYRIHKPSFAIISIGTDDYLTPARFEANLRQILDQTISRGIVPILLTKMDDANQLHYNPIITKLASAYDIPLVDLSSAMQTLPNQGMADNIHPNGLTDAFVFSDYNLTHYGWPVRNLNVLKALYTTWQNASK